MVEIGEVCAWGVAIWQSQHTHLSGSCNGGMKALEGPRTQMRWNREAADDMSKANDAFSSSCAWMETWSRIERTLTNCCYWWSRHCLSCHCWSFLGGWFGGSTAVELWSGHYSSKTPGCNGSSWRKRCWQLSQNWGIGDGYCPVSAGSDSSTGSGSARWLNIKTLWFWFLVTSSTMTPFTNVAGLSFALTLALSVLRLWVIAHCSFMLG